jgi:thiosulfate reductase cytochrome b subunit
VTGKIHEAVEVDTRRWIYRHRLPIRLCHWINVLCLTILLMSGLQIFNAHPALYWGAQSDFDHPIFSIEATEGDPVRGITKIGQSSVDTTGWLGVSSSATGEDEQRGFPAWSTVPGSQNLASGRKWHFFFAWLLVINGAAYLIYSLLSGHFRRDFTPSGDEIRHIPKSIWDHARLRFPKGDEARSYNVLQKLTYALVVFIMLPLMVLAGLTMSPGLDTAFPQLLTLFGGRQSARTVHFIIAWSLVAFVIVHVAMVILSGFWNNFRSMLTGRYDIETESKVHEIK